MIVLSPNGTKYNVKEGKIGQTDIFSVYECTLPDGNVGMFKIAATVGYNGVLDREAYVLETMKEGAIAIEEKYKIKTEGKNSPLNNHFFFPKLVETFIADDQDKRRVSILSFLHIAEKLPQLMPLSFLSRDKVRVDPKTSAWILGKLLKLLVFTHGQGIIIGEISAENILIEKNEHYVCIFNWTEAIVTGEEISGKTASEEISQVAKIAISILGGSKDGTLPKDEQLANDQYENFLKHLLSGKVDDAYEAHQKFYELIRSIWPRGYHEFTTKIF